MIEETHLLLDAIRGLDPSSIDPLSDPTVLAVAVSRGLMDAPQLVNNAYAPGWVRTRSINGAILAVDGNGKPIPEAQRIGNSELNAL